MNWEKIGIVYGETRAQVPTALIRGSEFRIYFSDRNFENKSYIKYIDLAIDHPKDGYRVNHNAILTPGEIGTFDYYGVMPSSLVRISDKEIFMYYTGWSRRLDIPYHNSVGLAISYDNGESFKRASNGPLFSSNPHEPYFSATPFVLKESDNWKCWYLSCTEWINILGKMEPRYHIKCAESTDGLHWVQNGKIAIDYQSNDEGGISQPSVIRENGIYKMWFSYRGLYNYRTNKKCSYRIGYAESKDGLIWKRNDELSGIDISENGWDDSMVCYPCVIKYYNKKYMFYNGNDFGKTGFGLAICKE